MHRWRKRHPELSLRTIGVLEAAHAKELCKENIQSFYENLGKLYTLHAYPAHLVWSSDEVGCQAGKNYGGVVIAPVGARRVQSIVPDQREWLSVLVCINAAGSIIPSFYIFRGKCFRQNYIQSCEPRATMAMQPWAWMISYLFSPWISRFI
jgi:hypothetical protein